MKAQWLAYGLALACLLIGGLAAPAGLQAAEPDYRIPAEMALPWACDTGHEVTWEPEDHWAQAKATGVAAKPSATRIVLTYKNSRLVLMYIPLDSSRDVFRPNRHIQHSRRYRVSLNKTPTQGYWSRPLPRRHDLVWRTRGKIA